MIHRLELIDEAVTWAIGNYVTDDFNMAVQFAIFYADNATEFVADRDNMSAAWHSRRWMN